MKCKYLTWSFLVIITLKSIASYPLTIQNNIDSLGDLELGMSLNDAKSVLYHQKTFLKEEQSNSYKQSIPIYELLNIFHVAPPAMIDAQNLRIYYDEEVFFDLRDLDISNPAYHFYYQNPYYMIEFYHTRSYEVAYASRMNPLLDKLFLRFIDNQLYAIEYTVQFNALDFRRFRANYYKEYGRVITPGDQTVERDGIIVLTHLENKTVRMIKVKRELYDQVQKEVRTSISNVVVDIFQQVKKALSRTKNAKLLILEYKKKKLEEHLWERYNFIDSL